MQATNNVTPSVNEKSSLLEQRLEVIIQMKKIKLEERIFKKTLINLTIITSNKEILEVDCTYFILIGNLTVNISGLQFKRGSNGLSML